MPKVTVYNIEGAKVDEIMLDDNVFGAEVNKNVLYEVVRAQLANKRQGTQSALTRAEVSGGGKKPWRQKGTGRARQGSIRSPQWRHGGVVFAPKPRDYHIDVNKKVKRIAMKSALSSKVQDDEIIVLDNLEIAAAKTKEMARILKNFDIKKALIVLTDKNETVERASSNIAGIKTTLVGTLNVYDILKYDKFIITSDACKKVEEVFA